jgi:hypothetical protein
VLPLAALAFLVHLAVIGPWLARMAAVGGSPTGTELKLGHNLYTYCGATGGDGYQMDVRPVPYPPRLEEMTPADRDRLLTRLALTAIGEHPGEYLRMCGDRAYYLFSPVPSFVQASPLRIGGVAAASILFFYFPLLAAVVGLIVRRPWGEARRLLVVALVGWYVFHIALHASIRQRIPSDSLVAVLALAGCVRPQSPGEPPPG